VLVVPSPKTQLHEVGVLVELSENWTVSGADPEDGELLNAATGILAVAAVVVIVAMVVTVAVVSVAVTAGVAVAAVVTTVAVVAVGITVVTVGTGVAVVGTDVSAGAGVDVAPTVSAITGRIIIAIKTRAASSTKKEFFLILHLSVR